MELKEKLTYVNFFSFNNKVKFWLLDEPTNNLDDDGKQIFKLLLKQFIE